MNWGLPSMKFFGGQNAAAGLLATWRMKSSRYFWPTPPGGLMTTLSSVAQSLRFWLNCMPPSVASIHPTLGGGLRRTGWHQETMKLSDESFRPQGEDALKLVQAVRGCKDCFGDAEEPTIDSLAQLHQALTNLPEPPENLLGELLPRLFRPEDPAGARGSKVIAAVVQEVEQARGLGAKANELLATSCNLNYEQVQPVVAECSTVLTHPGFSRSLDELGRCVSDAQRALQEFQRLSSEAPCYFVNVRSASLAGLVARLDEAQPLALAGQRLKGIKQGASIATEEAVRLGQALERVATIARRRGIAFDGSPTEISQLARPDGIESILPEARVDEGILAKAQQAANYALSDCSLIELAKRQQLLHAIHERSSRAIEGLSSYAQQLSLPFDGTLQAVTQPALLAEVASPAPTGFLAFP